VASVTPEVYLVADTRPRYEALFSYLEEIGPEAQAWLQDIPSGGPETLVEFAGRLCYKSWAPGLNPNVKKVRTDQEAYFRNILLSRHGSVIEHANFTFVFSNVSRVFTHEITRHRAGTAISQESLRFVRMKDGEIPFWLPDWVRDDPELKRECYETLLTLEKHQRWMSDRFGLDEPGVPFSEKKAKTSFMRRFLPEGVATHLTWTVNARELRHVVEVRTAAGAEEEIRMVLGMVAAIVTEKHPLLFGDFDCRPDGSWVPEFSKV